MKILLIRQVWKHHAAKSGYDRVFQTFEKDKGVDSIFMPPYARGVLGLLHRVLSLFVREEKYFSAALWWTEIKVLLHCWWYQPDIVHFTYLQKDFSLLNNKWLKPKARILATLHLPKSFWEDGSQSFRNFEVLDGVAVLDHVSFRYFNNKIKSKVGVIPHPVDKDYYCPSDNKESNDKINILFVGRFLRDFDLLGEIINQLKNKDEYLFHLVCPKEYVEDVISFRNVSHYEYLSENELLKLYQTSDVFIQPLKDATANNAILEAVACGLPVVVSDLESVRTYLNEDIAVFCKEPNDFILGIKKMKNCKINANHLIGLDVSKEKLIEWYKSFN